MTALRIATRGSALARIQTQSVVDALRSKEPVIEITIVEVVTRGDRDQSTPLQHGTGWFTTAIQEALQGDDADIAVHSYKDLPTSRPDGLVIAAVPAREDPRDCLVSRGNLPLAKLPPGAVIGTSSPRREVQLLAIRPDIVVRPIRGNVDTRLRKVADGEFDAACLALAGLKRLGLEDRASEIFGLYDMLPAPAQGALAVECRGTDGATRRLLGRIHDPVIGQCVAAERAFLAALGAGCSFPAAAYAEHFGSTLKLHAMVAPNGVVRRSKNAGPAEAAAGLGRELAAELMS
jgi:hydroxymethylbilane synthase